MKWICRDCGCENTNLDNCRECDSDRHDDDYSYNYESKRWTCHGNTWIYSRESWMCYKPMN